MLEPRFPSFRTLSKATIQVLGATAIVIAFFGAVYPDLMAIVTATWLGLLVAFLVWARRRTLHWTGEDDE